ITQHKWWLVGGAAVLVVGYGFAHRGPSGSGRQSMMPWQIQARLANNAILTQGELGAASIQAQATENANQVNAQQLGILAGSQNNAMATAAGVQNGLFNSVAGINNNALSLAAQEQLLPELASIQANAQAQQANAAASVANNASNNSFLGSAIGGIGAILGGLI
ncbi:MAG: hypothetical protein KGH96_23465, partial [Sphingomonadales bacterium]|nr:hypothetical protein [Sphingomonadales bacterium]